MTVIWQTLPQSLSFLPPGFCPLAVRSFTFFSAGSDNCTTCSGPRRDTTNLSVWVLLICTFLLNHRSSSCSCLTGVDSIVTRLLLLCCLRSCWVLLLLFPGSKPLSVPPGYCCLFFPHNFTCKWCNFHLQHTLCWASCVSEPRFIFTCSSALCITQASTLSSGNQSPGSLSKELLSQTFSLGHLLNIFPFFPLQYKLQQRMSQ